MTAAAVLFAILQSLLAKNSTSFALVRLTGGLFLTFTMLAPVIDVDLDVLLNIPFDYTEEGNALAVQGKEISDEYLNDIIIDRCETYILDKALSYQSRIDVEVELSEDTTPVPTAVRLQGKISPYAKKELQEWIVNNMGIPRENQTWSE